MFMKIMLIVLSILFLGTENSFSQENLKWVTSSYTPAMGLGPEENINHKLQECWDGNDWFVAKDELPDRAERDGKDQPDGCRVLSVFL